MDQNTGHPNVRTPTAQAPDRINDHTRVDGSDAYLFLLSLSPQQRVWRTRCAPVAARAAALVRIRSVGHLWDGLRGLWLGDGISRIQVSSHGFQMSQVFGWESLELTKKLPVFLGAQHMGPQMCYCRFGPHFSYCLVLPLRFQDTMTWQHQPESTPGPRGEGLQTLTCGLQTSSFL